jgi:hypothetical protein
MAKNLFYKIITEEIDNKYNRLRIKEIPEVKHNIDESFIININDFTFKRNTVKLWTERTYAYITKDIFLNVFENKLIFPTVIPSHFGEKYLGAVIVRCNRGDILTYLSLTTDDKIYIRPVVMFNNDESVFNRYETSNILPKRNVKVFLTKEEYEADKDNKKQKHIENHKIENELTEKVEKTTPVFSFKTPKFKIIEIVKKTEYLKDAKVGDIIYGEIPVIKETDNRKFGNLHGIGTLTNWVTLYINDVKINTISPKTFPTLFFNNIIVEEI